MRLFVWALYCLSCFSLQLLITHILIFKHFLLLLQNFPFWSSFLLVLFKVIFQIIAGGGWRWWSQSSSITILCDKFKVEKLRPVSKTNKNANFFLIFEIYANSLFQFKIYICIFFLSEKQLPVEHACSKEKKDPLAMRHSYKKYTKFTLPKQNMSHGKNIIICISLP